MAASDKKVLEKNLWRWLRDGLRGLDGLYLERVENAVALGTPDVDGCYWGHCFKIELKTCARPARPGTGLKVKVQSAQPTWWERYTEKAKGRCFVLLQVGSGSGAGRFLLPADRELGQRLVSGSMLELDVMRLSLIGPSATPASVLAHAAGRRVP